MSHTTYETGQQLDSTVGHTVEGMKHVAHRLGDTAGGVRSQIVHSQPVVRAQGFFGCVSSRVRNTAGAVWSRGLRVCQEHPHVGSAVTIWLALSTVPVIVFAGFTAGLFLTTVVVALATFLLPVNGAVLFVSGPTLLFSLFATTILAGFTYFWLFAAGLAVNGFRRVFPSRPAQMIDEGIGASMTQTKY